MESEQKNGHPQQSQKRKVLFGLGILIGILFGVALTLLLVKWMDSRKPKTVNVIQSVPQTGSSDTVVKYVIHKHESYTLPSDYPNSDTLRSDSTYINEEESFMMDEIDELELKQEVENSAMPTERMLAKSYVAVVYWDNDRNIITTPEGHSAQIQLQQWDTPIKNKISYQYSNNCIRIKGTSISQFKVIHYKGTLYLVSAKHAYPIHRNQQYERLVEGDM